MTKTRMMKRMRVNTRQQHPKKRKRYRSQKMKMIIRMGTTKPNRNEAPSEDFMIEKIFDQKSNKIRRYRYDKAGEPLYRVRWYFFDTNNNLWKPAQHLAHGNNLSYYRNKELPIPDIVDKSDNGWKIYITSTSCCLYY